MPLREMGQENHRTISCLPQQAPIASAPNVRFMVSWWDRQVHIWLLRKPAAELFASHRDDIDHYRKLLKSIVIKGDSNITSATVDKDGTLLVVSTATDVKAFRLGHQKPAGPADVQVATVELSQKLTCLGASRVLLSPNGRWLCVVREGSSVLVADIQAIPVRHQRLSRLRRDIPRHVTNGGLGRYDRTVAQITFSADSTMLAVADLAGFVDTWILHGHDEATAKTREGGDDDDAASSSDSSSADTEDEASDAVERWIRNPMAGQIPKLPSASVVLTFSDHVPARDDRTGGACKVVGDDYMLAAITSSWHVLAFHPCRGTLTPWTRRHPRDSLPAAMLDLLDLPKGVLWQGSRMWIYGVSFIVMLDTDHDVSPLVIDAGDPAKSPMVHGRKRRRTVATSGAGGMMEKENLVPHKVWKHGEDGQYEEFDMGRVAQRKAREGNEALANAGGESFLRSTENTIEKGGGGTAVGTGQTTFWMTLKYRPILGIVPLNMANQPLEVALVEGPAWDREMPDRYVTGDERDR